MSKNGPEKSVDSWVDARKAALNAFRLPQAESELRNFIGAQLQRFQEMYRAFFARSEV